MTQPRTTAAGAATGATTARPSGRLALAALSLSMLMPSLDTSIANAGLPTLVRAFAAPFGAIQWIVLAYLLAITTLIVGVGRLGDLLGRRRLLLVGIALFTSASLLCGLAPTLPLLITARAVQGLGAALMMALTVALVSDTVPPAAIGSAMGLLGTMSAIGTTLGPSLGGVLIGTLGWRAIFLVNVPIGIANLTLAQHYLPADRHPVAPTAPTRFDITGTLLLALGLAAYALAMTLDRGRFGARTIALLLAAAVAAVAFLVVERRAKAPLIRLALFRDPVLGASLVMSAIVSTVMMATLVVGPFYLSRGLSLPIAIVGIALSGGPLVSALTGVPAGRLVDRFGARRLTIVGLTGIITGAVLVATASARFGVAGYLAPLAVMTGSYALFQAANNTTLMRGIPADQRGAVAGMLSLSRNLGLITGAAAMGALFAIATRADNISTATPAAIRVGMRTTFSVAALLIAGALGLAVLSSTLATRMARRHPLPA